MRTLSHVWLIGGFIALGGCTANQLSIHRKDRVFDDADMKVTVIATDVRARSHTLAQVKVGNEWRLKECRDIPSDVYTLMGANVQGGLSFQSAKPDPEISGSMAYAIQESGRQIQRSQAHNLLNSIHEDHCSQWQGGSIGDAQYLALSVMDQRIVVALSAIENLSSMVQSPLEPEAFSASAPTANAIAYIKKDVDAKQAKADQLANVVKTDLKGVKGVDGKDPTCSDITDTQLQEKCQKDQSDATSSQALADHGKVFLQELSANTTDGGAVHDGKGSTVANMAGDPQTPAAHYSDAVMLKVADSITEIATLGMANDPDNFAKIVDVLTQKTQEQERAAEGPTALAVGVTSRPQFPVTSAQDGQRRLYIQVADEADRAKGNDLVQALRAAYGKTLALGRVERKGDTTYSFIRYYRQADEAFVDQLRSLIAPILGQAPVKEPLFDFMPPPKPGLIELWIGSSTHLQKFQPLQLQSSIRSIK
ncbi:hypothetical protein [Dyella flagellata]|uniref:Uncharacterized protein n=1 Tax=Dyella flagellata TaxID=1867833 RepID=A0ABQ5XBH0_9GAMM|nr:hypothetical protein [Dyella flagellata]GLQ89009.1 hypothetical protein GCM10007898_25810 [Dyella flagellata]